jgi:hypothetical protein
MLNWIKKLFGQKPTTNPVPQEPQPKYYNPNKVLRVPVDPRRYKGGIAAGRSPTRVDARNSTTSDANHLLDPLNPANPFGIYGSSMHEPIGSSPLEAFSAHHSAQSNAACHSPSPSHDFSSPSSDHSSFSSYDAPSDGGSSSYDSGSSSFDSGSSCDSGSSL